MINQIYNGLEFKKKRGEYLYNFLCEVNKEFATVKRIRNIFLIDGTPIFDLGEIPDDQKCLFVCNY